MPTLVALPAELTAPVVEPVLPAKATVGDLTEWAAELRAALRQANTQLQAILGLQPVEQAR